MQLPQETAAWSKRVRFGRYVARRLRRAQRAQLAADVRAATDAVKAAGRARDDLDEDFQDLLADRDGSNDAGDHIAQEQRNTLGGRGVDAMRSEPYTLIYEHGLDYYTAAPTLEHGPRYRDLIARQRRYLPEGDAVRAQADALEATVVEHDASLQAIEEHERRLSAADLTLSRAERGLNELLDRIYSVLRGDLGAKAAERFFPKAKRKKKA